MLLSLPEPVQIHVDVSRHKHYLDNKQKKI